MKTKIESKSIMQLVIYYLAHDIRCRNDDKRLTFSVMRHFTNISIPFADFNKIPSFDTIKRTRQKIQNDQRMFVPTDPKVIERRRNRKKETKDWADQ